MACIGAKEGGGFKLNYRFRWYRDSKAFDSKDERNWYKGEADDLQKGIETVRLIAQAMKAKGGGKLWELLRGNLSTRDFMDLLLHQPFAHAKQMTKAEYEAEYGQEGPCPAPGG